MRTFAIGDIHGHSAMLEDLLEQLGKVAEPGDTLVCVGDYIDCGPDSKGVVDRVLALKHGGWDGPVVTLIGNHEDRLLDHIRAAMGQRRLSYQPEGIPDPHWNFFMNLQPRYEDEHAYYVHAGFYPGTVPHEASRKECLWIRDEFLYSRHDWGKPVVFGHTPQRPDPNHRRRFAPLDQPNKIGIDTGSCYGGYLTAVQLPERRILQSWEGNGREAPDRVTLHAGAGGPRRASPLPSWLRRQRAPAPPGSSTAAFALPSPRGPLRPSTAPAAARVSLIPSAQVAELSPKATAPPRRP